MTNSCFQCAMRAEDTAALVKVKSKEVSDASIREDGKMDYEYETKPRYFCLDCLLNKAGVEQ